mmetsp:Transcript_162014/g.519447  ORF Transcript_162014/g.519447 Transcript_162014/m.519447 type:complete len:255 (+) Transcript_162014:554-1318(+)
MLRLAELHERGQLLERLWAPISQREPPATILVEAGVQRRHAAGWECLRLALLMQSFALGHELLEADLHACIRIQHFPPHEQHVVAVPRQQRLHEEVACPGLGDLPEVDGRLPDVEKLELVLGDCAPAQRNTVVVQKQEQGPDGVSQLLRGELEEGYVPGRVVVEDAPEAVDVARVLEPPQALGELGPVQRHVSVVVDLVPDCHKVLIIALHPLHELGILLRVIGVEKRVVNIHDTFQHLDTPRLGPGIFLSRLR